MYNLEPIPRLAGATVQLRTPPYRLGVRAAPLDCFVAKRLLAMTRGGGRRVSNLGVKYNMEKLPEATDMRSQGVPG
jgi:hypothetical protein